MGAAIVLSLSSTTEVEQSAPRGRPLTWGVRSGLVVVLVGLVAVFAVAAWLDPYDAEGTPRRMETHRQLGLPACSFKTLTKGLGPDKEGLPCPSCGMTTSFALLAHGDVWNSLRANAVGTLMAVFCVVVLFWGVASLVRGRLLYIRSLERTLTWTVAVFLTLMLVHWGLVLLGCWPPS